MNFCVPHKGQGKGEKGTGIGGRTVGATSQRCTSQLAVCLKPLWDDVMSTRRKAPQTSQRDEGSLDTRGAWASGDPSSGRRGARHAWRERERESVCVGKDGWRQQQQNERTLTNVSTFPPLFHQKYNSTFKKKAPRAIKAIKQFAAKMMKTDDVRVDVKLNKDVWRRGIRNVPKKFRIRIDRKRNDDEDAKEEHYSYVTSAELPPEGFSFLGTKVVE